MSINTLPYNPVLLQDVANAVQGYLPTTGITTINTPDNNLVASVAGNVADLSLASNITVADTVNTSNLVVSSFVNPFTTQPTVNGQVLSSTTAGDLSWATPVDTGITVINTPDNNLVASVVGTTADLSLASNITVADTVNTSNLVVSSFVNPFTGNQPATNGDVLSCTTTGALSWITPAQASLTGYLKVFSTSNGNFQVAQSDVVAITVYSQPFTNLDPTKLYLVRCSFSYYCPSVGGIPGTGLLKLNNSTTTLQTFTLAYSAVNLHIYVNINFDAQFISASASDTITILFEAGSGNLTANTDDMFSIEIDEIIP